VLTVTSPVVLTEDAAINRWSTYEIEGICQVSGIHKSREITMMYDA
jgi:hypothetical protein